MIKLLQAGTSWWAWATRHQVLPGLLLAPLRSQRSLGARAEAAPLPLPRGPRSGSASAPSAAGALLAAMARHTGKHSPESRGSGGLARRELIHQALRRQPLRSRGCAARLAHSQTPASGDLRAAGRSARDLAPTLDHGPQRPSRDRQCGSACEACCAVLPLASPFQPRRPAASRLPPRSGCGGSSNRGVGDGQHRERNRP